VPRASLLEAVRGLLERTYGMRTPLGELGPFVIGDRGWRELYAAGDGATGVASAQGDGARTLVREAESSLRASLYFPDAMIHALEAYPPQHGLRDENLPAFATFVEEIDHLLVLAERFGAARPISLFELELHANVSKHLVLSRFLAGRRGRLDPTERVWLRRSLYGGRFSDADAQVRERYHDARRYAVRLIDALAGRERRTQVDLLRRFHREDAAGKVELIERLAA
jgi:hypothetical protein